MKGVHHEKESKEKSEKDRTTISKEIRNHCFVKPFRGNNVVNCSLLLKPPYVCNGCENSSRCKQPKMLYDAAIADHEYHHNLSLLRANLKVTKDQVAAINDVVSPLMIHKHHSVNHVYVSHPEVLTFSYYIVFLHFFNYHARFSLILREVCVRQVLFFPPGGYREI